MIGVYFSGTGNTEHWKTISSAPFAASADALFSSGNIFAPPSNPSINFFMQCSVWIAP